MKTLLSLALLFTASHAHAVSADWTNISCSTSAVETFDEDVLSEVERINIYRDGSDQVELEYRRISGSRSAATFERLPDEQDSLNRLTQIFSKGRKTIRIAYVAAAETQVELYENGQLKYRAGCNSN